MSRKVISLQIGQCGNQVGEVFWKRIAAEHGIALTGESEHPERPVEDRRDIFFYQADDGRYVPRSILIDLEDRVVNRYRSQTSYYNQENLVLLTTSDGGGAGNIWSRGYDEGQKNYEVISELVRREVEMADSLEGFLFTHSVAGGTGSGVGSYLVEHLGDAYPKAVRLTYSVFTDFKSGDTALHPFNTVLTLRRLIQHADGVVVLDNHALSAISHDTLDMKNFGEVNNLISMVMAATTATLRFPSYSNSSLVEILAPLIPTPNLHFLLTGFTPIITDNARQVVRKTSVIDVVGRLLEQKNIMVSAPVRDGNYISILDVIQGTVDSHEIHQALRQVRENRALRFIPWGPPSLQIALSKSSPFLESQNRVSGLMLANHTSIRKVFEHTLAEFKDPFRRGYGMQYYNNSDCMRDRAEDEFRDSQAVIQQLINEYAEAEKPTFLSFDDE